MNTENLGRKLNITHIVISFLMAGVMYAILLGVCGIAPFGDGTWLSYDMKRQYVDYYAYYRTILSGENNIFYSFSTTLGSGLIGFFTYYLTSPFLILTLLFPVDQLPLAISLIIGLKLAASSATCDMMLQKLCGRSTYLCAIAYAFSGFMISNAMNMMWLDVLLLLPVVIYATEKLLHEGKLLGYTLSVALIIYLNYYISYITLIFVLLWSIARLVMTKNKMPQEVILRLGLATGAGIGLDAFIIIPTLIELRNSPKDILDNSLTTRGENIGFRQILSKAFPMSYDSLEIYWGKPLIFCGTVILILTVLYFVNKRIPVREKIIMAVLYAVMTVSFMFDDINILWHAGMEPSGYPYREAIVVVMLMIICSCRALTELKEGVGIAGWTAAVLILAGLMIYTFIAPATYMYPWKIRLSILIAAAFVLLLLLYGRSRRRLVYTGAALMIMVLHMAELGVNSVYIYNMESMMSETAGGFAHKVDNTHSAVGKIKDIDRTVYRMEDLSPRQQNDPMMHDYKGVTHYSSAGLTYVRYFLQKLGYNDDSLYTDYGHDNTETADSILGVKYLMSDGSLNSEIHPNYEKIADGDVSIYRNPYALPLAVGVYREMSGEAIDPFAMQEEIYGRLAGEPVELFVPADVQYTESDNSNPVREYRIITKQDGELYFYMAGLVGMFSNLEVYVNDEFLTYYGNDACLKVLNLGYHDKGDSLMVHIIAEDAGEFGSALFVTEDTDALKEAYEKTILRQAVITQSSASRLAMTVDSAYTVGDDISGEVGVFTTIPYQKGWKVKVCGVRVEPVEVYDALMYIPVTEAVQQAEPGPGEDLRVELEFIPEGFVIGVIVSILTLAVIILMASIRKGEASFFGDLDEEDEYMEESYDQEQSARIDNNNLQV